ncbi:uncharacterized protein LOC123667932 [Melitaea cinxia]|uniref:uncharacterized protein LOC123660994 n=1 Tax=Melitaea cinxia TaxID=113334 RepID=UPI001E272F8A|nr:uncharacterized protein LOC123660994 [Melitaea cinxia]XP_045457717.1 uncharacterized protein LOC123667932 [Melitaea cinxia]
MEVPVTEALPGKSRKRPKLPEKWKANLAKKERYSSHSLPEPITCNHDTKTYQCKKLKVRDLQKFHDRFYATPLKAKQDALILKCCTIKKTCRRRPTKNVRKCREYTIKYAIYAQKKIVPVCQQVFLNTLGIKKYRVQFVMQNFFTTGKLPDEKRGGDRKTQKYAAKRQSVREFIKSLKCVESHYCRSSTQQRKYLPSELNINKLYKLYKSQNPDSTVKSSYFRFIFNADFNLSFGTPRTDVCSKCIELSEKIKTENDQSVKVNLMTEKRIHRLKARAFFNMLREKKEGMATFSFDCQKNLVLPKLPDQSCYYSRQLYLYNFAMIRGSSKDPLNKDTSFAYTWTENEFAKSANEIASAVYDRLNKSDFTNVSHIRLIADGCGGQNKNSSMLAMCCRWLLDNKSINKIELVFPVTGHSYMPADRVFGNIEKEIRKKEVITSPSEYIDIIGKYATITELTSVPIYDWKTCVLQVLKTTAQFHFKISQCKRFILKRSKTRENVLVRGEVFYNSDTGVSKTICKAGKTTEMIKPSIITKGVVVKSLKLRDVKQLLTKHYGENWAELQQLQFYTNVLSVQIDEDEEPTEEIDCEMGSQDEECGIRV